MAQIGVSALVAGGIIANPILGFVGGLAAAALDRFVVYPFLFGEDETPQTLQDVQVQTMSEGAPLPRFYGPMARIPGHVIWADELDIETNSGGKGMTAQDRPRVQNVYATFSVAFGEGRTGSTLQALWCDEKLVYDGSEPPDPLLVNSEDWVLGEHPIVAPITGLQGQWLELVSVTTPTFYAQDIGLRVGSKVRFTGLQANSFGLNGVDGAVHAWQDLTFDASGETTRELVVTAIIGEPGDASHRIRFDVRNFTPGSYEVFLPNAQGGGTKTSGSSPESEFRPVFSPIDPALFRPGGGVDVYSGGPDMSPDPVIEAVEGVGTVEPMKGIARCTVRSLLVNDFGNRIPNVTSLWRNVGQNLVGSPEAYTLKQGLRDIMLRSRITADRYNFDGLDVQEGSSTVGVPVGNIFDSAPPFGGVMIRGPQQTQKIMQPVMAANHAVAQDREGVLHFFLRKNAPEVTVNADDLAAHIDGDEHPPTIPVTDDPEDDVPRRINVRFVDVNNDLQAGSTLRQVEDGIENVRQMDVPLTMSKDEAEDVAQASLFAARTNRRKVGPIFLPPSYIHVAEGDLLKDITIHSKTYDVLVTKIDEGANGLIEIEGMVEDKSEVRHATALQ